MENIKTVKMGTEIVMVTRMASPRNTQMVISINRILKSKTSPILSEKYIMILNLTKELFI